MSTFATDTFTDTNGVGLTSHAADLGGTWVAASWSAGTAPTIQSNKLRCNGGAFTRQAYYSPATPASADYSSFATLTMPASGDSARCYPGVRMSTSAQTGYFGGYQSGGKVNIYKWVAGSITEIGAAMNCAMSAGDTLYCEVEAIGTTIKAYFQRGSDSQWLVGPNSFQVARAAAFSVTDSSISAAGKAGLWEETLDGVAFDIDGFGAFDTAAAAPVITGPGGAATGPTQGNAQASTDTATGAMYYLPRVGGSAALAAAIKAGGVRKPISAIGAAIQALTGLTTNTTNSVDIVHDGTDAGQFSNVVTATIAPQTLASSGSPSAQTGTAGGSLTWTGATPDSFVTNHGNGSGAWSIVSSAGFTVAPSINPATGVLSGGTFAGAGAYAPQIRYTDSSTVPSAQTLTFTLGLTVSGGDTTAPTMSSASVTGGTLSATGSITSSEAGTLWWKMDGSATATDPGAGSETGAGWTSQSMTASANAVNFGAQPAGTRYGHFIGVDAAGNRAAVVNASGTVSAASPPPSGALPIMLGVTLDGELVILS